MCPMGKSCTLTPFCGDGKLNGTEQCDDGNLTRATAARARACSSLSSRAPWPESPA